MLVTLFIRKARTYGLGRALALTGRYIRVTAFAKIRNAFMHSYSQYGEDLVIDRMLGRPENGTYVDVGASDPDFLSNTKRFYERGWRGVNIEPITTDFRKFVEARPHDVNLNIGVGPTAGAMDFHVFEPHQSSTFSAAEAEKYKALGYKLIEVKRVEILPLSAVFAAHSGGRVVDFLSVDTEGFDLQVLQSNDWERTRPKLVCVECSDHDSGVEIVEIADFMRSVGYERAYFNGVNAIWRDARPGR